MLTLLRQLFTKPKHARRVTASCAWCGKIRDGIVWVAPAEYLRLHGPRHDFTHGVCPDCHSEQVACH